jgi:predicted nucleic acid-binding protein
MTKTPPRIYWDANAWIAYIRREMPAADNSITEPRFEMCRDVLKRAEKGEIEIATSAFTMAEVCKRRSEAYDPTINLPAFFDQRYILLVPVDKQVGLLAQHLQLTGVGKLKPADATHVASALVWSVPVFHTFDGPLRDLDKVLQCKDGTQLRIVRPGEEVPMPELLKAMQNDGTEAAE